MQSALVIWKLRVSAVSYLNTWPLIWGFQHGPEQGIFDFRYDLPAQCAAALENGEADIGLVPSAELDRLALDFFPDVGIACEGPVRSILLISHVPVDAIRTLAVDSGSRTSVALARIILSDRYGCIPEIFAREPQLDRMLLEADAALVIGDPALRLEPEALPMRTLDLGEEWVKWTGLPMVFAVWAGRSDALRRAPSEALLHSYEWGRDHMDEIVRHAATERGFPQSLAREYLTKHIRYRLGPEHLEGLARFRALARALPSPVGIV
jgi:predicted solute-binding protein